MSASLSTDPKLAEALAECERLREDNRLLRQRLELPLIKTEIPSPNVIAKPGFAEATVTSKSTPDDKVKLFRSLFRGRDDVYAVRWEGRNGKAGYSPADHRVWGASFRSGPEKPKEYFLLMDQVIHDHLTGKLTAGIYLLLTDETCWFLAADFDKATWQDDVRAFLHTCAEWRVPAVLERSRSGRGGHVWIFFETPVPARLARGLGAAVLTRTMERRYKLGLDSYDRFFPSQDTMPKGGFGNLIALPLQHLPRNCSRAKGKSFIRAFRSGFGGWQLSWTASGGAMAMPCMIKCINSKTNWRANRPLSQILLEFTQPLLGDKPDERRFRAGIAA
jgi:hypothetical protein